MPIQMKAKICRWAKKGGKIKRGSTSRRDNAQAKALSDSAQLVANARSLGWYNGEKIRRR